MKHYAGFPVTMLPGRIATSVSDGYISAFGFDPEVSLEEIPPPVQETVPGAVFMDGTGIAFGRKPGYNIEKGKSFASGKFPISNTQK